MSRLVSVLCLIVLITAACAGDRPVLVGEPRPEATESVTREPSALAAEIPDTSEAADDQPGAADGPVLRLAVVGEPIFDPIRVSAVEPQEMALIDLVADGLTEWDPQRNTWTMALAETVETLDAGQTWRFTLGAETFSDGSAMAAEDVVRSFERVMADALTLPATRLEVVEAITAVDRTTVEFSLTEPFADFPSLISSPFFGIVTPGVIDGVVGSGPFALGPDGLLWSDDLGYGFEFVSVADEFAAVSAFEAGDVDLAFVSARYPEAASVSVASAIEVHFALNLATAELVDVERRRAVVDAVSRTRVTDAAFGAGAGAVGRMVPAALACAAPCGGGAAADPVEVGPLSVVYVDEPTGREAALADALVAELVAAGIEAAPTGLTLDDFVAQVSAGQHHLVRTGWVGLFPSADSQLAPYRSASPDNVSGYASEAFDDLLAAARTTGGASLYQEAQALLQDEAVVLPIARLRVRALVSDRITSIELRHDGSIDLESLRLAD